MHPTPSHTHHPTPTRTTIIGAGPGGLLCARILQHHGHPVTVYDLDAALGARHEGGSLDLHADSGQLALQAAGLLNDFLRLARREGQAQRRYTSTGALEAVFEPGPDEQGAPEIDRSVLRALLADALQPNTVAWGHKLNRAESLGDGRHRLTFENGTTAETDLLIGADGAWSRVRPLLTPAQPLHSGVIFLTTRYDDVDHHHLEIAQLVGDGLMVAFPEPGDGTSEPGLSIWAQRAGNGSVTGYLTFRATVDWAERAGLDLTDRAAVVAWLRARYRGWSSVFDPLLAESDAGFVSRPIVALPAPLSWTPVRGVTLLGDAAHVMPPLGQGVNLALQDAWELAAAISEERSVDAALQRYEGVMLARAGRIAAEINAGFAELFGAARNEAPGRAAELSGYREAAQRTK